jgi:hypothetical protein
MNTPSSLSIPRTPNPVHALRAFSPLISWALVPLHSRAKAVGIESPSHFIRRVLFTEHAGGCTLSELRERSAISSNDLVRIGTVYDVIEEAGWLTWKEYCYLIVTTSWREGDGYKVYDSQKSSVISNQSCGLIPPSSLMCPC